MSGLLNTIQWAFDIIGKGADRIHSGLDVIQGDARVRSGFQFHPYAGRPLVRVGDDPLDALEILDRLFDLYDYALLHLRRSGAPVGCLDVHHLPLEIREHLQRNAGNEGPCPDEEDQHHEQVGGDAVLGEPVDDAFQVSSRDPVNGPG